MGYYFLNEKKNIKNDLLLFSTITKYLSMHLNPADSKLDLRVKK